MMFIYTTTGNNWSLVANNDYTVKKSITNNYWRLIEGAFTKLSSIAVIFYVLVLNFI